jgi:hypothetical protein
MKKIFTIALLALANLAYSNVSFEELSLTALPEGIRYLGKPFQAIKYQDKTGEYLALSSQSITLQQNNGQGGEQLSRIHIYVYRLRENQQPFNVYQMHDRIVQVAGEVAPGFAPGTFSVTDMDKNGKAELWLGYRLFSLGNTDSSELKIMMLEGTDKYARRGTMPINTSMQDMAGAVTSDSFAKGPALFARHASYLWNSYTKQGVLALTSLSQ